MSGSTGGSSSSGGSSSGDESTLSVHLNRRGTVSIKKRVVKEAFGAIYNCMGSRPSKLFQIACAGAEKGDTRGEATVDQGRKSRQNRMQLVNDMNQVLLAVIFGNNRADEGLKAIEYVQRRLLHESSTKGDSRRIQRLIYKLYLALPKGSIEKRTLAAIYASLGRKKPGINSRLTKKSYRHARNDLAVMRAGHRLVVKPKRSNRTSKLASTDDIETFVKFLLDETNVQHVAYGTRNMFYDGEVVEVPDVLRVKPIREFYIEYQDFLRQEVQRRTTVIDDGDGKEGQESKSESEASDVGSEESESESEASDAGSDGSESESEEVSDVDSEGAEDRPRRRRRKGTHLGLSLSLAYKIIKAVAPTRQRARDGIDHLRKRFLYGAIESLEILRQCLAEDTREVLEAAATPNDRKPYLAELLERCESSLKNDLKEVGEFLRGPYRQHVKAFEMDNSVEVCCVFHCTIWCCNVVPIGASKEDANAHKEIPHEQLCSGCQSVFGFLDRFDATIEEVLGSGSPESRARYRVGFEMSMRSVVAFMAHVMRAEVVQKWAKYVRENLDNDTIYVLADYPNKPYRRQTREGLAASYGQTGFSLLITVIHSKVPPDFSRLGELQLGGIPVKACRDRDGEGNYLTYIDAICEDDEAQDSRQNLNLFEAVFQACRYMFPDGKKLHIQTDGARPFSSNLFLSPLFSIAQHHGFLLLSITRNEPGDGKDKADAHAAIVNLMIQAMVDSGLNMTSISQLFFAIAGKIKNTFTMIVKTHNSSGSRLDIDAMQAGGNVSKKKKFDAISKILYMSFDCDGGLCGWHLPGSMNEPVTLDTKQEISSYLRSIPITTGVPEKYQRCDMTGALIKTSVRLRPERWARSSGGSRTAYAHTGYLPEARNIASRYAHVRSEIERVKDVSGVFYCPSCLDGYRTQKKLDEHSCPGPIAEGKNSVAIAMRLAVPILCSSERFQMFSAPASLHQSQQTERMPEFDFHWGSVAYPSHPINEKQKLVLIGMYKMGEESSKKIKFVEAHQYFKTMAVEMHKRDDVFHPGLIPYESQLQSFYSTLEAKKQHGPIVDELAIPKKTISARLQLEGLRSDGNYSLMANRLNRLHRGVSTADDRLDLSKQKQVNGMSTQELKSILPSGVLESLPGTTKPACVAAVVSCAANESPARSMLERFQTSLTVEQYESLLRSPLVVSNLTRTQKMNIVQSLQDLTGVVGGPLIDGLSLSFTSDSPLGSPLARYQIGMDSEWYNQADHNGEDEVNNQADHNGEDEVNSQGVLPSPMIASRPARKRRRRQIDGYIY